MGWSKDHGTAAKVNAEYAKEQGNVAKQEASNLAKLKTDAEGATANATTAATNANNATQNANTAKTNADNAASEAIAQANHAKNEGNRAKAEADRLAGTDVSVLDNKIGSLSSLNTTNKTSVVASMNEVTTQLAHNVGFSPIQFGAVGDGVADDTKAMQDAIDYARANGLIVINKDRNLVFNISKPLYVDRYTKIDLGEGFLCKTTNTVGTGSNPYNVGTTITDSYAVDAFFIVRHPDNFSATEVSIKNVRYKRTAPNRIKYAVFAPRLARCEMENMWSTDNTTDYLLFGYQWYMMQKVANIKQYGGIKTFLIANDGSDLGGSTSIIAEHIVGHGQDGCIDWYGAPYSIINNAFIDQNNGVAFRFASCHAVTVNAPSIEFNNGKFLEVISSRVVMSSARVLYNQGSQVTRSLILASSNANLTMIGCEIRDYEGTFVAADNLDLTIADTSHVFLINTRLPTNGNAYRSLTGGSTLTITNNDGTTYRDAQGVGTKINGLRRLYGTAAPTTGTWLRNEQIINTDATSQIEKWLCVVAGIPGTWEAISKYNRISKNGIAALVGDGTKQTFTITHDLGKTPTLLTVAPENSNAGTAEIEYYTSDTTQITLRFKNAVPSGVTASVRWYVEGLAQG